jgi:hypothetical protein
MERWMRLHDVLAAAHPECTRKPSPTLARFFACFGMVLSGKCLDYIGRKCKDFGERSRRVRLRATTSCATREGRL